MIGGCFTTVPQPQANTNTNWIECRDGKIINELPGFQFVQGDCGRDQEKPVNSSKFNGTEHFKNVNNCLNTSIYSYLETSGGQSYNLYQSAVHFFNASVN